jgi:hypothetical protein
MSSVAKVPLAVSQRFVSPLRNGSHRTSEITTFAWQ